MSRKRTILNLLGCGAMSRRSKSFTGVESGVFEIFVVVFNSRYGLPEVSLILLAVSRPWNLFTFFRRHNQAATRQQRSFTGGRGFSLELLFDRSSRSAWECRRGCSASAPTGNAPTAASATSPEIELKDRKQVHATRRQVRRVQRRSKAACEETLPKYPKPSG